MKELCHGHSFNGAIYKLWRSKFGWPPPPDQHQQSVQCSPELVFSLTGIRNLGDSP